MLIGGGAFPLPPPVSNRLEPETGHCSPLSSKVDNWCGYASALSICSMTRLIYSIWLGREFLPLSFNYFSFFVGVGFYFLFVIIRRGKLIEYLTL
jgi:hypothetical protein